MKNKVFLILVMLLIAHNVYAGDLVVNGNVNSSGNITGGGNIDGTGDLTVQGNVGVGTSTPAEKLDVNGNIQASGNITVQGNIGIGTDTPQSALDVNGSVKISDTNATCDGSNAGTIKFTGTNFLGCVNGRWKSLTVADALTNNVHNDEQCIGLGGTVMDDGSGNFFCKFNQSSCPSGWFQYNNWSSTSAKTCTKKKCDYVKGWRTWPGCTTGSHASFQNKARETCTYSEENSCTYHDEGDGIGGYKCGSGWSNPCQNINFTCYANITEVGCY